VLLAIIVLHSVRDIGHLSSQNFLPIYRLITTAAAKRIQGKGILHYFISLAAKCLTHVLLI